MRLFIFQSIRNHLLQASLPLYDFIPDLIKYFAYLTSIFVRGFLQFIKVVLDSVYLKFYFILF